VINGQPLLSYPHNLPVTIYDGSLWYSILLRLAYKLSQIFWFIYSGNTSRHLQSIKVTSYTYNKDFGLSDISPILI
jgi:hypothetical protein